jgi:peptide/nickel transport system substrate-binding protein
MCTYIFPMDSEFYTGTDDKGQPKDAIVKIGPSFALTNESGTGPYKVARTGARRETGSGSLCRVLGQGLAGQCGPIVLTPIKEDATRVAALLSGDVDFISPVPPRISNASKKTPR